MRPAYSSSPCSKKGLAGLGGVEGLGHRISVLLDGCLGRGKALQLSAKDSLQPYYKSGNASFLSACAQIQSKAFVRGFLNQGSAYLNV